MGMSASQARYLQLTARRSNLEFEAQQICQQRLMLAEHTDRIANEYTAKISDRHLYFKGFGEATFGQTSAQRKRLDYYDITKSLDDGGLGMQIVDINGKIIVPSLPTGENINPDDYIIVPEISFNSTDGAANYENACNFLESHLRDGEWFMQKKQAVSELVNGETVTNYEWVDVNYLTCENVDDLLYKENDSAAEATYKKESESLQKKDKALEMRLQQITTEQEAVKTEQEAIEKIITENIEKSFKTFA